MVRFLFFGWLMGMILGSQASSGWWNADSLARSIPAAVTQSPGEFADFLTVRFPDEADRVRALFSWITCSIIYDMNQTEAAGKYESVDEFVFFTLKNKRAVCQGYAEVFTTICKRMGIPALTVHGYTRNDGQLRTDIGHAWNIAKIDGRWSLFDATWGSGSLDNGRYRKSFSPFYFMTPPDNLITTHMPFDPIWQLLDYPITHDQFIDGGRKGPAFYQYADSLDRYYNLDEIGRAEGTLRRAEATHATRKEILRIYRKYNDYVINMKCNVEITLYNEASTTLQTAIDRYNEFQELHNRRNADLRTVKQALGAADELVRQALHQAFTVSPCQGLSVQEIQQLIKYIREVESAVSIGYSSL
ncbi:MAG: hypothetical protein D4R67_06635 [Bacteroidetes bacterium]|nr:MAG: hypothetical protein D4R67_06635 [Bacteroidota bacterium]